MEKLYLVSPNEEYKEKILEYKKEFAANSEIPHGIAGLDNMESFEEWLCNLRKNENEETVLEGRVTSSTFIGVREADEKVVGFIDIRHRLNDYLLNYGGHIGYSVRKSERRKGYATEMLRLALLKCKELHIEKALVTCYKDNAASAKTIIANGGVLENEIPDEGSILQRYWITI